MCVVWAGSVFSQKKICMGRLGERAYFPFRVVFSTAKEIIVRFVV